MQKPWTQPILLVGALSLTSCDRSVAPVSQLGDPGNRVHAASGGINGKLYVFGGYDETATHLASVVELDPVTNQWSNKATAFGFRFGMGYAVLNNRLYVVGGTTFNGPFGWLDSYHPATDQWSRHATPPTMRRAHLGAAVIDGILYAVGGLDLDTFDPLTTLEAYDPATDTWTTKASMPTPRYLAGVAAVNGKLYVVGGYNNRGLGRLATVEVYDPATDSWSTKASLPERLMEMSAEAINGGLYIVGGTDDNFRSSSKTYAYDPATDSWALKQSMPTARSLATGAVLDGRLYLSGGYSYSTGQYLSTVEAYQP